MPVTNCAVDCSICLMDKAATAALSIHASTTQQLFCRHKTGHFLLHTAAVAAAHLNFAHVQDNRDL